MIKYLVPTKVHNFYIRVQKYFNPIQISLGRWDYNISNEQMIRRVELANEDHCGPCGEKRTHYYENTIKK
jgi:hypothetical protein